MDDETVTTVEQWRHTCDRWEQIVKVRDAEIVALKRQIRILGTCGWHKNGFHMERHVYWATACNNMHQFNDGGPKENHFEFCPYCSALIEEVKDEGI